MLKYEAKKGKDDKFTLTVINQKRMGTKKVPWRCVGSGMTEAECKKKQQRVEGLMSVLNQKQKSPATKQSSAKIQDEGRKQAENRAKEYIAKKIGF